MQFEEFHLKRVLSVVTSFKAKDYIKCKRRLFTFQFFTFYHGKFLFCSIYKSRFKSSSRTVNIIDMSHGLMIYLFSYIPCPETLVWMKEIGRKSRLFRNVNIVNVVRRSIERYLWYMKAFFDEYGDD